MKKIAVILLSTFIMMGCVDKKSSNTERTEKYFNARNSFEYKEIQDLISDSLTVIEGDYVMHYSQESFYEVFRWDSVFQTTYEIVELKEMDEQIVASISLSSIRNRFLKNDLMTCQFKLTFTSGKISTIESLDCKGANWEIWQNGVNNLVDWIEDNHPELNGFIHDMTMNGAKNYLKAISLYESNQDDL